MIPIVRPWLPPLEDYVDLLREVWDTRMLSNFAEFSQRLEQLARNYLGSPNVLATSSGDIALIVTLRALDLPEGSPCFVSDFTFNSTINAALWNRLRPVPVDIDPQTLNLSPGELKRAMQRHPAPGVVLATHTFGNPCDADELAIAAAAHRSFLVFDAAHAYGSLRDGRHVGTFGDAEVFSLSGTKLVTSAEGGLVSTRHDWLADRIIYLRAYGFQHDYVSRYVGMNGKLSELHSALGVLTLPHVETVVDRRKDIVAHYLRELEGIALGQQVRSEDRSTYKDVALDFGEIRADVEAALTREGVQVKRYFVPLHSMDLYARYADGEYPGSSRAHAQILCVPAFIDIDSGTVQRICDTIQRVANE